MFDNVFLQDETFLKLLEENRVKEVFTKIEILDFNETVIADIQGRCTSGTLNIDGNSSMRRTCNLSLIPDEDSYGITSEKNVISINKKIRVHSGYKNNIHGYEAYGDIVWFPLGVFIVSTCSISHGLSATTINVTAKDKMTLLNGEVGGMLPAPVSLHEKYTRVENSDDLIVELVSIYDIIREAVIHLGGEDPARVIINDVPNEIKKVFKYEGKVPLYYDAFGNQLSNPEDPNVARVLEPGDLAGYDLVPFNYPGELVKQAGESVTSILDSIVNILGNYEYFYSVDGNFIFQEKKNYLNTNFTPVTELSSGDYSVNFGESPNVYSFRDSDIIVSYNNNPNYQNIKNDFVVWGMRKSAADAEIPIRYHVAIDRIPQDTNGLPWQVFLYNYGKLAEGNGTDPGYYYRELQSEIPKLFDFEKNDWKGVDGTDMDAWLDFIDDRSELGKYSVSSIGRRTVVVNDNDVKMLYRPNTPDFIILEAGSAGLSETIKRLQLLGQKYLIVSNIKEYTYASVGKDAFSVIRDLIFKHTTYNESINISALPLYHLEPNTRIEVEDIKSDISGDYIISSMSIPLTHNGTMNISAVRATSRI